MKKMSIGSKITISFTIVIVMFILVSIITLTNSKRLDENYNLVNHTHEVLAKIEMVVGGLKDAETGQRGFIITGMVNYLEPYDSALISVRKNMTELQQLTIDNDIQQQQIIKLNTLVNKKFDELKTTIIKRRISFEAAKEIVISDEGKKIMDDIRLLIKQMINHENSLLKERETLSDYDNNKANTTTIWITIGAFVIVILLIIYFTRIIAFPIRKLSIVAQQIALGDLTGEISKTDRKDEIGVLTESFNFMQQYMREKATQANQIAEGNMTIEVKPLSKNDTMGVAFALMLDNLRSYNREQRQSIKIIEQKERYLHNILNNAVNGIVIIDEKGTVETVNLAIENIFGYSADEVIGKNVSMLANEKDRIQHDKYLKNYLKTKIRKIIGSNKEVIGTRKDGSKFPLRLGVSEIEFQDRTVFMGMISDLTQEKEAENALHEIEERFKNTFDQAPVSIANIDLSGRFQKVNHVFCTLFGYTEKELLKMDFSEVTYPDDIKETKRKLKQLIEGKVHEFSMEKRFIKKNSELMWGKVTVSMLKDKYGDTQNLIGIVEDISLRKATENKLKNRSEELEISNVALDKSKKAALSIMQDAHSQRERAENAFRELKISSQKLKKLNHAIEQSTSTIVITDKTGKIEYVNPVFTKISGYTTEEVYGHKPGILKSGKHKKAFYKNLWNTILAGKTWKGDIINKKKTGEEYVESASISPMFNKDGEITHFVAVKEDITIRKKTEEELRTFKRLAESSNEGFGMADLNSNVLYMNKRLLDLCEIDDFSFDDSFLRFYTSKSEEEIKKTIMPKLQSKGQWQGELEFRSVTGNIVIAYHNFFLINDENGKPYRMAAIVTDISKRKQIEIELQKSKEQAEEANRLKSTFLSNMSHEIRTPMNAILGFSEILSKRITDKSQLGSLSSIQSSGKTLLQLINNILDLSKIESGKLDFSYEPVNIQNLVEGTVEMLNIKSNEKGLKLNAMISKGLPSVINIDELRIKQILINLVNNAIKFTEKGNIEVEIGCLNKKKKHLDLLIKVEDTGIGISKENYQKIFQAFDQIEGKDSKRFEGTGLGLAITKHLVTIMNGTIELESEVGKGSIFTVVLNKVKYSENDVELEDSIDYEPDSLEFEQSTVLIVDDVKTNRDVLVGYISSYNIKIIEAENGEEALMALEKHKTDLVFLDLRMPVMDGYEAYKIIKKNPKWSRIPVIAITASVFDKDEKRVIAFGFNDYIRKPAGLDKILSCLMKHLKHTVEVKHDGIVAEVTLDSIDKLDEVLLEIDNKVMPVWEEIKIVRKKKNIVLLASLLIEIGEKYKAIPIINYGNDLQSAFQLIDINMENRLIQQFPDFIKKLKS